MTAEQQNAVDQQTDAQQQMPDESSGRGWIMMLAVVTILGVVVWLLIANGDDTA